MTADADAETGALIDEDLAAAGDGRLRARRSFFLSTAAIGPRDRYPAMAALAISAVVFGALAPFAGVMLPPVPAFIPAYESALIVTDLIASLLLFGQFSQLRSAAILVLASGYLFDALMIVSHALTFPGLFASGGLIWAGPQSTPWIYMFWHGGFALSVIGYVLLQQRREASGTAEQLDGSDALLAIGAVVVLSVALTLLATLGRDALPDMLVDNRHTAKYDAIVGTVWGISAVAMVLVWRRRERSALDLWLVVVMAAWAADIALSAMLNIGRWDIGFYFGRAYGLLAAGFVVAMILLETSGLYSRLAQATVRLENRTHKLEKDFRGAVIEQRQTEAQLRQAQKMEALGNLTGGMAHDFNNLLGALILNLETIGSLVAPESEAAELVELSLDATLHGAELTRHLLAFARRQPLQPQRVELNGLIDELTRFLSRTIGAQVEIALNLAEDLWPVVADPSQIESALTNLANNARDAMPNGGKLLVLTANRALDADYADEHDEVEPGDYAMIQVTDTGSGMSPETLTHVFEPFFTTKGVGKGSGLGLAMVFGFMKQSGGHINVYSEPGVGTTFRLYLPRSLGEGEVQEIEKPPALAGARGETVLAVEDNPGLRRVVVRQLNELGYRVLEAETAAAALEILKTETADLLLTDVVMPGGMSGVALARVVSERWPAMHVVLTSGFPDCGLREGESLPAIGRLLSKPYRRADLAQVLREALDA